MKILHINYSDINGGAAKAAKRIHDSILNYGLQSNFLVKEKFSNEKNIIKLQSSPFNIFISRLQNYLDRFILKLHQSDNKIIHSPSFFSNKYLKYINESDADIVNLHWIQGNTLSIKDVARINKPMVWTLHDMWAFCGAEHYTSDTRWTEGYKKNNRPHHESGFDINLWTWQRKKKNWKKPIQIVSPSNWLANCVSESDLMGNWPVDIIPYPIDHNFWSPIDKKLSRKNLNLRNDVKLLLFGAMGGIQDPRKGFDLLISALKNIKGNISNLEILIFGQSAPQKKMDFGFPVKFLGNINDHSKLRALYSASDIFALPSRQDNLPLTCIEALSCGLPVIAFNSSGPPSMIEHKNFGYLSEPYDTIDFANGIKWILDNLSKKQLNEAAINFSKKKFSPMKIAQQYFKVYQKVLN